MSSTERPRTMAHPGSGSTRRTLLVAGAASLAVGGLAGLALWADDETTKDANAPAGPAIAGSFDIARPTRLWRPTALNDTTGPQSLAFDDTTGDVYVVQQAQGGLRLRGEKAPVDAAERKRAGDLCVTRFSGSGEQLGRMYLRGFGHGVSMGVQAAGRTVWLWVESRARGKTAYGQAVTRVPFEDGAVLDDADRSVRPRFLAPRGSLRVHPAVDPTTGRLLVGYLDADGKAHGYSVHRLRDVLAGDETPLWRIDGAAYLEKATFQGCTLHGDYIYQLTGNPYSKADGRNPRDSGGNTFISALDVRTGRPAGRQLVSVDPSLRFREPEGIAVRAHPEPLLCMGFSVKTTDRRKLALYGFDPRKGGKGRKAGNAS
ncbi:phage baseplate protein [Streptomyces laurentii]|uniref:phage baseplate protein n=1 Tax=Streptomyces laurentii TaxID=39478 RepID=UPI00340DB494